MSMLGIIPTILRQWYGSETKNVRPKRWKILTGRMTLLNFFFRLQRENYVYSDSFQYSTNKNIWTANVNNISPSSGSYFKFSISLRVLMVYACCCFGTKFEHAFIHILIIDFDLKKLTSFLNISTKVTRNWGRFLSLVGLAQHAVVSCTHSQ